jgi:hypothetical protein
MGWSSSGRSSGPRRGKRGGGGGGGTDKPKQPQRGLGVAQLEKIRLQSEMAEYFHPLGGQAPSLIHRTGSLSLVSSDDGYGVFAKRSSSVHRLRACCHHILSGSPDFLWFWNGSI